MSNKELIERGREFARSTNLGGGKHLVSALCDALESGPRGQGEPSDARHAEHVTVEWAYESDCLEGECAHRDEDGEPEDMSVCPTVPPFEVCVGCMEDEGRGIDPEQWDDVPLMSWPCPAALRAANEVENR